MLILICGIGAIIGSFMLRASAHDHINKVFGYRTKRSMKNRKLWEISQVYAAKMMLFAGIANGFIGGLIMIATRFFPYKNEYYLFIELLWVIVMWSLVFALTEKKLKEADND
ncbi:SdpI/YhfL protein family protein [Terribacillus aidingensis]|uniref:SdpI/YhfL protein family protein n=1 Tax=Terribacillus aidingensis TaxID=586416 RepID=A0A285P325_9BACI|nr:SdpI family protein [Terribacillus aidingensis]SNZ16132.1 SdpI/YhfL protein family protein [Terribacillus aidingensis]